MAGLFWAIAGLIILIAALSMKFGGYRVFEKPRNQKYPAFIGLSPGGHKFRIGRINIWEHKWDWKAERFDVLTPDKNLYNAELYSISIGGREVEFLATELSSSMWGFWKKPATIGA